MPRLPYGPTCSAEMAARLAQDIPEGWYVNLGIGIPTMVGDYVPLDREVILHSENGILGMGPAPAPDKVDPWLINAGKQAVTLRPGGSYLPPRRQLRDDPRRAYRPVRARRLRGRGERRHRQLGDQRERHRAGGRRRDGPRRRGEAALGDHGAHHQGWPAEAGRALRLSADRAGRGEARLHQPRRVRRGGRARASWWWTWHRACRWKQVQAASGAVLHTQ